MPYNLVGGANTIRESFLPRELLVLLTVLFSVISLQSSAVDSPIASFSKRSKVIVPLGKMSLSVFLWHQPLFAFYRYLYADNLSPTVLFAIIMVTLLLSRITYLYIERRICINKVSRICLVMSFVGINAFSLWVYGQGGAVRDVPELDIRKGNYDPTTFERYTDRIYLYDRDFDISDTIRRKVLVVGNSFARDFANILLESSDSDLIQISYRYSFDDCPVNRICESDRIYFFGWKHQVPDRVWNNVKPRSEVWGIGSKNHGTSNGIFYKNRTHGNYFNQRVCIRQDFIKVNQLLHDEWQDKYVDLLSLTLHPDSTVPVFTPDHHFITYDGMHLTPAGVRYYNKLLSY